MIFISQAFEIGLVTGVTKSIITKYFDDIIELGVNVFEEFIDGFFCHNYKVVKRSL